LLALGYLGLFVGKSQTRSGLAGFRVTERNDVDAARDYMPRGLADSPSRLPDYECKETSDVTGAFREESMVGKMKVLG